MYYPLRNVCEVHLHGKGDRGEGRLCASYLRILSRLQRLSQIRNVLLLEFKVEEETGRGKGEYLRGSATLTLIMRPATD